MHRVLILRTRTQITDSDLTTLAASIEEKLRDSAAVLIIKQKPQNQNDIKIVCCGKSTADDHIKQLERDNFTDGL